MIFSKRTSLACDAHVVSGMRGERSMRAAASLAALATLLALSAPQLGSAELTSTDPILHGLYGDACSTGADCHFPDAVCDDIQKTCQCHPDVPISNYKDKCGKAASINETCMFNGQCEDVDFKTECKNERCACKFEMVPEVMVDGGIICTSVKVVEESTKTLDPAMIGVLVGMAVMFIIICVVLQLFSRARWRENRTIFNTPNPRLMNVSLLRDSKLLHSQDRRGSRVSVRPPSRQASQQELRPHSPSPARHHQSHQLHRKSSGSRRGSRASSGHSATSLRSATLRSPTTPGPTSVTVEIRAPEV
ncbi:EB domain-containing julius seizure protein isoform X2 [Anticarsia gemmatalis]|uniref:EB domain-containing julius seizure protein isoform X2 n=1 Tax=Anticarsia gemmatalis TaxID=129554 RepID=UPI003F75F424